MVHIAIGGQDPIDAERIWPLMFAVPGSAAIPGLGDTHAGVDQDHVAGVVGVEVGNLQAGLGVVIAVHVVGRRAQKTIPVVLGDDVVKLGLERRAGAGCGEVVIGRGLILIIGRRT